MACGIKASSPGVKSMLLDLLTGEERTSRTSAQVKRAGRCCRRSDSGMHTCCGRATVCSWSHQPHTGGRAWAAVLARVDTLGRTPYPEGGNHVLQVCQHHHQAVRVSLFCRVVRVSKNMLLATAALLCRFG